MSMINNAQPGSSILILSTIDQYLRKNSTKSIDLDLLKEHLRPDTLAKSENALGKFKENLNFWLDYKIWHLQDNQISLVPGEEQLTLEYRVLRNMIKNVNTQNDFFENNNVEPFFVYLSSLIEQDRYSFAGGDIITTGMSSNLQSAINQYAELRRVPNSNESTYFIHWSVFLGFMEPKADGYMLDPTRAILPYLKLIFAENQTLSIREFLDHLSEYLPMFGDGRFNQYLREVVRDTKNRQHQLSAALSHALLRFEMMNKINLNTKSDDIEAMELYQPKVMPMRLVSTISWKGSVV